MHPLDLSGSTALWMVMLSIGGAIIGSFVAALTIRWPEGRSVMLGRSSCDHCGHVLRARDLVPLLSWLVLSGRCRDCGGVIDRRHVTIEVAATAIGLVAGMVSPDLAGLAGAVFGWMLLALACLDLAALWLPDRLTVLLAVTGPVAGVFGLAPTLEDRLIGGVAGFLVLWSVGWAYRRLRGREGLGGGDPKLLAGIGLWLGWRLLPGVLLIGSALGLGVAIGLSAKGRAVGRDTPLPFGAFLAAAAYIMWVATTWVRLFAA
ncbi:leader peptidase (prepilin peptidase) / N-methyltransferase [Sphingomonas gellani]|uniref:Prepilin leader peptidase/N-methyltransferase n=1 Tax=Sphingomonas gellani TaxID=1166340 RepID=A0A1H8EUU2_9SPHN|nr:A24 family peptidase [Sphingomonas gellani]SEN23146.1 leader peptidase (prepilin peptidase) / N-methyltransferase [Sphingomonas gellani]